MKRKRVEAAPKSGDDDRRVGQKVDKQGDLDGEEVGGNGRAVLQGRSVAECSDWDEVPVLYWQAVSVFHQIFMRNAD
jgi:hypothetical protein